MSRRWKSKWNIRNCVPGNYRHTKDGKTVRNPGFSVHPADRSYQFWRVRPGAGWYKPFKAKPKKHREKRGQAKPH